MTTEETTTDAERTKYAGEINEDIKYLPPEEELELGELLK